MYLPPPFDNPDRRIAAALMRAHSFATLVVLDDEGLPFLTHLPLLLAGDDADHPGPGQEGAAWILRGHCAKPNPLWRYLAARPEATVSFLGPHAYMSPSVYPDLARVPTWNYLAVTCRVHARLVEAPEAKDALLKQLIAVHEPAYAAQWQDLDPVYQQKMLQGLVGFELGVTSYQCKLKLNQHRPEAHAAMHASYAQGSEDERALATWMTRLGMVDAAHSIPGAGVQDE